MLVIQLIELRYSIYSVISNCITHNFMCVELWGLHIYWITRNMPLVFQRIIMFIFSSNTTVSLEVLSCKIDLKGKHCKNAFGYN